MDPAEAIAATDRQPRAATGAPAAADWLAHPEPPPQDSELTLKALLLQWETEPRWTGPDESEPPCTAQ